MFGFIGVGNMGYPLLCATIKKFGIDNAAYYEVLAKQRSFVKENTGLESENNIKELVLKSKYIILAIKPQYYEEILAEIKKHLKEDHILISIAPGISINKIKTYTNNSTKIIRSMPNTPAMVGQGMTCISYSNDFYNEDEINQINKFFNSFGKCEVLDEELMDIAVCASGSSPAYVYMFIEALADSIVKYGMPRDKALKIVSQTVLGSAKMVIDTNEHPAVLKDRVCSPGGTTIEGVIALEKNSFRNSIIEATNACYKKVKTF